MEKEIYDGFIYRKRGRKYEKFGVALPGNDYLTEGIWVVSIRPGVRSRTNGRYLAESYGMLYKAGEVKSVDLTAIAGLEKYAEMVCDEMSKMYGKNLSNIDIARRIVKRIFDFNNEEKQGGDKMNINDIDWKEYRKSLVDDYKNEQIWGMSSADEDVANIHLENMRCIEREIELIDENRMADVLRMHDMEVFENFKKMK